MVGVCQFEEVTEHNKAPNLILICRLGGEANAEPWNLNKWETRTGEESGILERAEWADPSWNRSNLDTDRLPRLQVEIAKVPAAQVSE